MICFFLFIWFQLQSRGTATVLFARLFICGLEDSLQLSMFYILLGPVLCFLCLLLVFFLLPNYFVFCFSVGGQIWSKFECSITKGLHLWSGKDLCFYFYFFIHSTLFLFVHFSLQFWALFSVVSVFWLPCAVCRCSSFRAFFPQSEMVFIHARVICVAS